MKNTTIFILVAIAILVIGGFFYINNTKASVNGNSTSDTGASTTQKITLSMKNGNYFPNTITVKANQPVSISLDSSVGGCYRTLVIPAFGISKYSSSPTDTIDFTPTTPGTYRFTCGMGMGTGTLVVE